MAQMAHHPHINLEVQTGDQLAAGQPIVQEWAQTMQQGVPRFQDQAEP